MSFHPDKCKALSTKYIYDYRPDFDKILPFPKQHYMINNTDIDFSEYERDLGVLANSNLRWEDHNMKILNKAHQMLGFTKSRSLNIGLFDISFILNEMSYLIILFETGNE